MTHALTLRFFALTMVVTLFWGFSFVFVKAALQHFTPYIMLCLRFAIVAAVLLPFYRKPPAPMLWIAAIAFSFSALHLGCMFWSLYLGLNASLGLVVEQISIPMVLLLGALFFKEKISAKSMAGVAIAIVGTFFLMGAPNSLDHPLAFALMIGSAISWALYSLLLKKVDTRSAFGLIAWISLLSFFMMLPFAIVFESNAVEMMQTASLFSWLALLYTVFGVSITAHGLWCYVLTHNPIQNVAPLTLLVPLFGIVGGAVILNEPLSTEMIVGAILMTIGVGIVVVRRPKTVEVDLEG